MSLEDLLAERLAAEVARLVEERAGTGPASRELMNAKKAADFLRISHDLFSKMASRGEIPRHAVSERNYVYARSEILEWVKSRPSDGLLLD